MKTIETWLERAIEMYDESSHKDGDVLSHEWIRYALDVKAPASLAEAEELQWVLLTRVDAFREWLLVERKTALQSVRGKGYWVVPPAEQARVAAEEAMKLVHKGLQKGTRIVEHARLSDMQDDERKRHTDTQVRLSGLSSMMNRQRRDVFKLFAPKEG